MLTITPNRRLAAFLAEKYNQEQALTKHKVWIEPQILHLEAWFAQLWQLAGETQACEYQPMLDPIQQQILWEQIIQASDVGTELLRIPATAENALQAWKFICEWQLDLGKLAAYAAYTADTKAFYAWLQDYLKWLQINNYIDRNLMLMELLKHLPKMQAFLPNEICLVGVDEPAPIYSSIIVQMQQLGTQVLFQQLVQPGAKLGVAGYANTDTEFKAAARWAAQQLDLNPQQKIGIVVPNLESVRQKVVREFTAVFPIEHMNISAPLALAQYPMIDHALLILSQAKDLLDYADLSILLRSPFVAGAETSMNSRANKDRILRESAEAKISLDQVHRQVQDDELFAKAIKTLQDKIILLKAKHSAKYWLQQIQDILFVWGWPGERALTVEEAHLYSCWQDLLHSYGQLAIIIGDHSYSQALQLLQRLAMDAKFLPAESGGTKLHILGVLEGAGLYFDHLWVTGMSRETWPPDAAPNPFIPLELQRQLDMPRSSPQRELKVARRLTNTLKQGAEHSVVFSYPLLVDDHPTQLCNLLSDVAVIAPIAVASAVNSVILQIEAIEDVQAPKVQEKIIGGSNILKLQAQCPFKAFAEIRIAAKPLKEPQLYLNAAERGEIVHDVLEKFWQQCAGHAQLTAYLPAALAEIINDILQQILLKQKRKKPHTLSQNYMQLERKRLQNLLSRWLELETKRESFTVHAVEHKIALTVGELDLSLRVDRIDLVADKQIIIDYKTGVHRISSWYADRISEPQLPLYSLKFADSILAVSIANLKADDLSFVGLSEEKVLPGVRVAEDWQQQLSKWREILHKTASDFIEGKAAVDPYSTQVCQQCKLHTLCRIYDN